MEPVVEHHMAGRDGEGSCGCGSSKVVGGAAPMRRRAAAGARSARPVSGMRGTVRTARRALRCVAASLALALIAEHAPRTMAMRLYRPWTSKHWCDSVVEPQWPFAYSKFPQQHLERKGRVNSNIQDMRHKCAPAGVQSKCHICERIKCGNYLPPQEVWNASYPYEQQKGWRAKSKPDWNATRPVRGLITEDSEHEYCDYQIQGVEWKELPRNVPTVSDTPWAVGAAVTHRNDFGRANRVCVMLSGGHCVSPYADTDKYKDCTVRCWGSDGSGSADGTGVTLAAPPADAMTNMSHNGKQDSTQLPRNKPHMLHGTDPWPTAGDYGASDSWERNRRQGQAQGKVELFAGSGCGANGCTAGKTVAGAAADRDPLKSQLDGPQDVAVDKDANVYVADTRNNRIVEISLLPSGKHEMRVYAGDEVNGEAGFADGKAKDARFSAPAGISVFYDWRDKFVYQGCFVDTDGDASRGRDGKVDAATRDLPVKAGSHARMNPTMCWRLCHAYKYFGVQRGTECWCGNNENVATHHPKVDDKECNIPCPSYGGTPEDPPWGSVSWGAGAPPAAQLYPTPGQAEKHIMRTDYGKCGGMWRNSVYMNVPKTGEKIIFVADTGNHRVRAIRQARKVRGDAGFVAQLEVVCIAGRCGKGTFSRTRHMATATPQPGYADGTGEVARLHAPMGVAVDNNGTIFVADTGNRLVRFINYEGVAHTLAGSVEVAEKGPDGKPKPGCPPPCLKGVAGTRDGLLTEAQFMYPSDVTVGLNATLVVTDNHRVRRITYSRQAMIHQNGDSTLNRQVGADAQPKQSHFGSLLGGAVVGPGWHWDVGSSTVQGVQSRDRVVTLAGHDVAGRSDGEGARYADNFARSGEMEGWARFNRPEGIAMDTDGRIYVSGTGSCRIRRISSARHTAILADVSTATSDMATRLWRPSGCNSYNPAVDSLDFMATAAQGNIYYRYGERGARGQVHDFDLYGRHVFNCLGTPPPDALAKGNSVYEIEMRNPEIYESSMFPENYNLTIAGGNITEIKEDTGDGSTIKVRCPDPSTWPTLAGGEPVYGSGPYADFSSVCRAAKHAGALNYGRGHEGLITVTMQRGRLSRDPATRTATLRNGVQSQALPAEVDRVFTVEPFPQASVEVQTIAGHPTALLEDNAHRCGYVDNIAPPQDARFDRPSGLAIYTNASLTDGAGGEHYIYIADTNNNAIRRITATCSQICENGGTCEGADKCKCKGPWTGYDCTEPVCTNPCGNREVCVGGACACVPGYTGPGCTTALCVQDCNHGGYCSAPDTCACPPGWFDANCTTPVCTQTCGNGGNCTGPNICTCPDDWTGVDCRVPVCEQAEWNGHDGKLLLQEPGVNTPQNTSRLGVHPVYRCRNGGYCSAPNTCICPPQWSGHDCASPVCTQGYFKPDPDKSMQEADTPGPTWGWPHLGNRGSPYFHRVHKKNSAIFLDGQVRPLKWQMYVPCDVKSWGKTSNTFDFQQIDRTTEPLRVLGGAAGGWRKINGHNETQPRCHIIEMGDDAVTQFQYLKDDNTTTPYSIYTQKTPFGPNAVGFPWRIPPRGAHGSSAPWGYAFDRQVALVELHNVTQGVYVCANGGNCTAPDICSCAKGWMGFDCRTPICEQGYFEPQQLEFTMPDTFDAERGNPNGHAHPRQPDSNPAYTMEDVNITYNDITTAKRTYGDIRYLRNGPVKLVSSVAGLFNKPTNNTHRDWGTLGMKQKWTGQSGLIEVLDRQGITYYAAGERPSYDASVSYVQPNAANGYHGGNLFQGGYSCSVRSLTHWEKPSTLGPSPRCTEFFDGCKCTPNSTSCGKVAMIFQHPNYYSRYMNWKQQVDGINYTDWFGMEWVPLYEKCQDTIEEHKERLRIEGFDLADPRFANRTTECLPPELDKAHNPYDEPPNITAEGHRRDGVWRRPQTDTIRWRKGICVMQYNRSCPSSPHKAFDQVTGSTGQLVYDPDASFRARLVYDYSSVKAAPTEHGTPGRDGRWFQEGGECVDEVIRGCYNNGTCVAPNTCRCATGWTGYDCSVPICHQECQHNGNCTLPDTCTCEKGWTGRACEIAMCAQECNNGGECIAPDVCECKTWPTVFRDLRKGGGRPLFQQENGDPMVTGWTGYDCNTPICVQAKSFVPNALGGSINSVVLKGRAKWDIGCSNRFSCSQEQPLEDKVKDYVSNLCYSVQASDCMPAPKPPEEAYKTCPDGLEACLTLALKHRDLKCGGLCTKAEIEDIYSLCKPTCTTAQVNLFKNMVAKCKSDCGAIRGWWVQAQFDGMLTLGMEAKIPIPGKCYDKGDKYRNNPVNEIDPCPHAPYMPNLCAERDVCVEYDRNVAKNDGASFQSGCYLEPDQSGEAGPWPRTNPRSTDLFQTKLNRLHHWNDKANDKRWDNEALCYQISWFQGDYIDDGNSGMMQHGWHHMVPGHPGSAPRKRVWWPGQVRTDKWCNESATCRKTWGMRNPMLVEAQRRSGHALSTNLTIVAQEQWCRDHCSTKFGKTIENDLTRAANAAKCAKECYFIQGRHMRTNHRNIRGELFHDPAKDQPGEGEERKEGADVWKELEPPRGEGIYQCYNLGTCIFPDRCTCPDGYDGFDCQTPLCRHMQTDKTLGQNRIASCLNGGVCIRKDTCQCVQTESILWKVFPDAPRGLTGYMSQDELPIVAEKPPQMGGGYVRADAPLNPQAFAADGKGFNPDFLYPKDDIAGRSSTDCSIAICVQGFYDPNCEGVAPGGQGCYRCNNGGNCTAPDHCTCAEGWTGYDCMTPVCTQVAEKLTRKELFTVDEERVHAFEMDPCGSGGGRWGADEWEGLQVGQGNCTMPNVCTCLCKKYFSKERCRKYGTHCLRAWSDPLSRSIPWGFTFGGQKRAEKCSRSGNCNEGDNDARDCYDGYEGNVDDDSKFTSCHLAIYVPAWWERDSLILIAVAAVLFFFGSIGYFILKKKLKQRYLLAKAERRRSRKSSSEDNIGKASTGAFGHK